MFRGGMTGAICAHSQSCVACLALCSIADRSTRPSLLCLVWAPSAPPVPTSLPRTPSAFRSVTVGPGLATPMPSRFTISFTACDDGTGHWTGTLCDQCQPGWYGRQCNSTCPTASGAVCGGHGRCDDGVSGTGKCACDANRTSGYWTAPACDACQADFYGHACAAQCPTATAGVVCAGHGVCDAGRTGGGACACDAGYTGPACATPCPVSASGLPCGGHGVCQPSAECECAPRWGSAACDECVEGWTGADCACQHGNACWPPCYTAAVPCSGHGQCSADDGTCHCASPFAGPTCAACAPGRFGEDCARVCVEGQTVGRLCVCSPYWALPDCSRPCDGGVHTPCSGHGTCADGRAGNGSCACDAGWLGPLCSLACPGVARGRACSGHGVCTPDAACECFRSRATGHWVGAACEACAEGWVGPRCERRCPVGGNGTGLCSGHGVCDLATEGCTCHASPDLGFWEDASNCTECLPGYYGARCDAPCPGGACNACNGHGVCDWGVSGSGKCTCNAQWTGPDCGRCEAGLFGLLCESSCPMGYDSVKVRTCIRRE